MGETHKESRKLGMFEAGTIMYYCIAYVEEGEMKENNRAEEEVN